MTQCGPHSDYPFLATKKNRPTIQIFIFFILFFFTFSPITHTRGHTFKLFKYFSRTDARKYFFTRRVVEPWKNLPQEVACAASVDDFKKLIDQYSSNTMYKCM